MTQLWQDLRYAARALRRAPLFTAVAALTLALGIGANSAIFSVVSAVLLAPLPVPRAEELVVVRMRSDQGFGISVSIPNAQDWMRETRVFSAMAAARSVRATITGGDRPERIASEQVLGDYFATLGVGAAIGRVFTAEETQRGAAPVAVLGHAFWQNRFGGDPAVVGQTLSLSGRPYTIVGVLAPGPERLNGWTQVFTPLGAVADLPWEQRDNSPGLNVIARMKPGVEFEQAVADLDRVGRQINARSGQTSVPVTTPLRDRLVGDVRPALLLLVAAVGLVLLIACANVANLLLARGETRQRELAVRTALGASSGRIVRQLLTESALLALLGGALGVAFAAAAARALRAMIPEGTPNAELIGLDGRVLAFTVCLSLATGIVFGLLPAMRAARAGSAEGMREGARGASEGRERQRLRGALVAGEIALAVLLLAGLTARSFLALRAVDPGFDPNGVLVVRVAPTPDRFEGADRWRPLYAALLERVRAVPGVRAIGLNSLIPLDGSSNESGVVAEGGAPDDAPSALRQDVSPGYFAALGIRVVRGRIFTDEEARAALPVAVVDERLAERFWPGQDPIGRRIAMETIQPDGSVRNSANPNVDGRQVWRTVVGVVRNVRFYELEEPSRIQVYRPLEQVARRTAPPLALFIRNDGDHEAIVRAVRQAAAALDPDMPVYGITSMTDIVSGRMATSRLIGRLLVAFGLSALLLAAIGIYGVMAYTVARRAREIGVRLALGAQPADVVRLVVGRGGRLAAIGVAIGLVSALALSRAIAGTLYGVKPWDPATFALAPLILGAVALFASWLPARRAARIDPAMSLQAD